MAGSLLSGNVRVIGKNIVDAKLLAAAPAILANNRAMVTEMLKLTKEAVVAQTPLGPGRDGHLREQYTTDVKSTGINTTGVLKAPPKGYWYEFGTGMRYRGRNKNSTSLFQAQLAYTRAFNTGGEPAHLLATHAVSSIKRVITAYYGGLAKWWGSSVVPAASTEFWGI
jgi:hypothetical protein